MSAGPPLRPALVVHRLFMQEFLAAEAPCFAPGMVEERQRLCGMLALRLDQEMPAAVADGGFEFGHALFGTTAFVVLHLVFAFPGFQTYNVLINPNNPLVQALLRTMLDDGDYFFFALTSQGQVIAFRAEIESDGLAVLRANRRVCRRHHDGQPIPARPHVVCRPSRLGGDPAPVGLSRNCRRCRPHHQSDGIDPGVAGMPAAADGGARGEEHVAMVASIDFQEGVWTTRIAR